ncbi:hypothetical protein HDV57DRAFT_514164 [Trichoderma longibrachiatum]
MKTTFFFTLLSTALSLVAADIVITPIFEDQIVQKQAGDCFFGVVTPQGRDEDDEKSEMYDNPLNITPGSMIYDMTRR